MVDEIVQLTRIALARNDRLQRAGRYQLESLTATFAALKFGLILTMYIYYDLLMEWTRISG